MYTINENWEWFRILYMGHFDRERQEKLSLVNCNSFFCYFVFCRMLKAKEQC